MTQADDLHVTQEFFTPRAATWEEKFPNDGPLFAQAVAELQLAAGGVALDLGCGTGRALAPLRQAVGPTGNVVGLDATVAMLAQAQRLGRGAVASLLVGDAACLPFETESVDVIFAGGLLPHLIQPSAALEEFARVVRPGGKLAVFHPIGRVALAARHNHVPSDDDMIAPRRLTGLCQQTGWQILTIDDGEARYLAVAVRVN